MDRFEEVLKEKRIIKQFSKKGNQLIHPFSPNGTNKCSRELGVYLYTLILYLKKTVMENI